MKIFTIGFTKTSAERFFKRLSNANVHRLVDVRLNNVSQLSGFAKRDDLEYFTRTICGIEYCHKLDLAPTKEMLDHYKKNKGSWEEYAGAFMRLMESRRIEKIDKASLEGACLLCSEDTPHHCHRRLVAEYLRGCWEDVDVVHL
jgi:uncharacterized protein (DUF488 family)